VISRRAFAALVLGVLAVLVCFPSMALARMGDHGETVLFKSVYIAPDEVINGDLNVIFGDAEIAGHVRGDVNTIFGSCKLDDGAQVDGDEHCVASDGMRAMMPWISGYGAFDSLWGQDRRLLFKLGSSAIVLLIFLLFPMRMRLALDRIERHPGICTAAGTALLVLTIPAAILFALSIIGIPLIVVELAALIGGVWLGTGAVALLIGRRFCELVRPQSTPSPLFALIVGLVFVSAAESVPIIGWAVMALIWLVGLGGAGLTFVRSEAIERFRATLGGPRIAPPGTPPGV
jgi:hypothetical protein